MVIGRIYVGMLGTMLKKVIKANNMFKAIQLMQETKF